MGSGEYFRFDRRRPQHRPLHHVHVDLKRCVLFVATGHFQLRGDRRHDHSLEPQFHADRRPHPSRPSPRPFSGSIQATASIDYVRSGDAITATLSAPAIAPPIEFDASILTDFPVPDLSWQGVNNTTTGRRGPAFSGRLVPLLCCTQQSSGNGEGAFIHQLVRVNGVGNRLSDDTLSRRYC